ncbi:MAG: ABC transporter ATP-binding protein [Colwellia sp.]|nr:ABC transporter ATP-binding protein [Colwellia sp.]
MLKFKNLCKFYQTDSVETVAIDNMSITINKGEFVSVMGPSGCGKSTFLNIVGMLDNPTSGEYTFLDKEVSSLNERGLANIRKQHLGFIFQSFNLIDELSVWDNIELPLIYQNVPAAERKSRVTAVLAKVDIAHRGEHMPQQLSGGQQQRVAVARALVSEPELILADEPTGNLDSKNGHDVMTLLQKLNAEGSTIVMVTHSQAHAQYGSRIINLLDGKILSDHQIESADELHQLKVHGKARETQSV